MTAEKWKEIKSLFEEVINLDPLEEQSYLDENCQDKEIRKEVESLLESHKIVKKFSSEFDEDQEGYESKKDKTVEDPGLSKESITSASNVASQNNKSKHFTGTSRFLIQKRLGEGGFGVVYQAYDREHNSIVALKTLHQTEAEDLYRFKKEFRGLADISHPNLAAMYELFSEEDHWFFTMEMVYGVDFLDYVKRQTIISKAVKRPFSDAITSSVSLQSSFSEENPNKEGNQKKVEDSKNDLLKCRADLPKLRHTLKQLAEGLCALHNANRLHRDLKPSNVLVDKDGRVVILDFGLVSELTAQGVNQVTSDSIMGTPVYMSPEHISGQPISPASDWYSVGIMLYLSLTGVLPFQGTPVDIMLAKQRMEALPPSALVSGVPEDLDKLCQNLLKRSPTQRPTGEEILAILGDTETPTKTFVGNFTKPSALFVGREKELAILNQAWQLTKQGKGATVYIKGRSGMGKSTIVRHFLEKLEKTEYELLIFSGRCYEQESVPYKVVDSIVDLLSRHLKNLSTLEVEALLPLDTLALARLFPVLKQVEAVANFRRSTPEIPDPQELRRKAFSALRELLIRLTNKKDLVVFIDDLQWGDNDSVGLLLELIRPPDAPRMLLIGSYRSEEAETSMFLKSLFALQSSNKKIETLEISVGEFSKEESYKLAVALLGEEVALKQSNVIIKESAGSPFFINELAQYSLSQANDPNQLDLANMTIDKIVNARIALLSKDAKRLLETVAVSGQPLPRNIAKKAARITLDEQVLPILRTNHLLRSTGNNIYEELDTYHDRIREAVIKNLSEESLKNHHYALALALETFEDVDPERLAKHFQLAGERDKASEYTMNAAEQADQILAFEKAAQLYKQSLALKSTQDITTSSIKIKLGNALSNSGQGVEAAKAYLAATYNSSREDLLKLQHKAAEQFLNSGYIDEGVDLLNEVLRKVNLKMPETNLQAIISIVIGRIKLWLRGMDYKERIESEVPTEILIPLDICWTLVDSLSVIDTVKAIDFQTRHLKLALDAGEPYRLVRALAFEFGFFSIFGKWTKAYSIKQGKKAIKLAQEVNKPELIAMVTFIKSANAYQNSDWKEAWDLFCLGEKISLKECRGDNYAFALRGIDHALNFSLRALLYLGDINELNLRISTVLKTAKDRNNLLVITNLMAFISYMQYLVADEADKALLEISQVNDLWIKKGVYLQQYWKLIAQVEIGLYLGKGIEEWQRLEENWPALKKSMLLASPNILIEALHLQARVALACAKGAINKEFFLKIARKNAKKILKEKRSSGNAWAELILAGIETLNGKIEKAIDHLEEAEKSLEKANMKLYLAATKRKKGELLEKLKNNNSKDLIISADNWMYSQQIKEPAKMTAMLLPGFN